MRLLVQHTKSLRKTRCHLPRKSESFEQRRAAFFPLLFPLFITFYNASIPPLTALRSVCFTAGWSCKGTSGASGPCGHPERLLVASPHRAAITARSGSVSCGRRGAFGADRLFFFFFFSRMERCFFFTRLEGKSHNPTKYNNNNTENPLKHLFFFLISRDTP